MRRAVWGAAVLFGMTAAAADKAPCPHPWFPMQDGLTLTYRAGKSEVQVDFSDVRTMGEITQGTLHLRHKGKDGTTEAVCGPDGIHTQLGGIEGAALDLSGMDVTVLSSEGVAMPPPDQMVEGATWTNTLALELTPPKLKDAAIARMKTTFKKVATIEGREKVRAAGRVWDALRVKNRITAMAGTAGERTMESTLWIARGVGILKIQTGDTVDLELLSVKHLPKAGRAQKRAR